MSEDLRARLRRLRREPAAEPAATTARDDLPQWFRARAARAPLHEFHAHARERTLGPPKDLCESHNAAGAFAARTTAFALDHRHGRATLCDVERVDPGRFVALTGDESLRELAPRECVYLDIETTGLSGGAGTKAFLVALGRFSGGAFELWQGFLRGPEEERALLLECAERIRAARGVISFFGKSFDRHRLEDKMRMHRVAPPFAERPHLDLYYPGRRLYRASLPNCRLATLERAVCGVERAHDLSGAFAPSAWFDYLAGRAHVLEDVFRHNQDDVLSLVTLHAHLGSAR